MKKATPAVHCWNCGKFTSQKKGPVRLCGKCSAGKNGVVLNGWHNCVLYDVKKSDVIDHVTEYAPCP